jgi:uncharacterized protein
MGPVMKRWFAAMAGVAALATTSCRLDSRFLYYPQPHSEAAWRAIGNRTGAELVEVVGTEVALRGWYLRPREATPPGAPPGGAVPAVPRSAKPAAPSPVIIYLGGNGEEVSWMLGEVGRLAGHGLLAVNYRGYGASGGAPLEQSLYDDAVVLYDWLAARPDVDPTRIAVWGRSLGTGVATWLAAKRPVSAVILTSPYDSIEALARLHFAPMAFLLGQRFDSISRAPQVGAPLLAIVAGRDTIVPPGHSERLVAAWGGPTRVLRLPAATHNDVQAFAEHWREVERFLQDNVARR